MMPLGNTPTVHASGSIQTNPANSNSLTPTGSSAKSSTLVNKYLVDLCIYI